MNNAKALIEVLKKRGVKYIFGIPGEVEFELFEELSKEPDIQFIQTRHEQAAAFMADIQGRINGKAGVCYSTLGPGMTNLTTGIANAHQDRSPVVALSGQLSTLEQAPGAHMYIAPSLLFSPITKYVYDPYEEDNLHSIANHMFDIAEEEKQGPVHLTLPEDAMKKEAKPFKEVPLSYRDWIKGDRIKDDINEFLKEGKILTIIGNLPVRLNQVKETEEFLRKINTPYFVTYQGKGVYVPELYCGTLSRHLPNVKEFFDSFDKILLIGYDYIEGIKPSIWGYGKQVFYIDSVPHKSYSDYKQYTTINLNEVYSKALPRSGNEKFIKFEINDTTEVTKVIKSLRQLMGKDDILVSDVGLHKQYCGVMFDSYSPKTTFFSNGLSSMGFGLPAALSAKLSNPDKNVVLVAGDGGFMMNSQELATMQKYNLPINIVLINDTKFGIINKNQEKRGYSQSCDLLNPNFEDLIFAYARNGNVKTYSNTLPSKFNPTEATFNEIKTDYKDTVFVK